jgi:electron transfer flavoprotein alpha subunit
VKQVLTSGTRLKAQGSRKIKQKKFNLEPCALRHVCIETGLKECITGLYWSRANMENEIWIFAEHRNMGLSPTTIPLLSAARKLARAFNGKACACILGPETRVFFKALGEGGAEKIYFSEDAKLSNNPLDFNAIVLQRLTEEYRPRMFIFDALSSGSELASRISWRMGLSYITEVKRIDEDGKNFIISRSCYGDKVFQNTTVGSDKTAILTILPFDTDGDDSIRSSEPELVEILPYDAIYKTKSRCIEFLKGDPKTINIEDADLIVAGGKGIGNDGSILEDLADALGASVGGTRPLVDEGIIPFERQIGITGKSVAPRLLFTIGVSGAREFVAGTEKAKLTIAINSDDKAPIFKNADMKIHGDLKEIVPTLMKKLKHRKESFK